MCGIVGICNLSGRTIELEILKNMTDTIAHRGPDGEGHYIFNEVGLGHRRLAIIDLSDAAHQPMIVEGGRFVISYNGEVYNFKQLREELKLHGYIFRSQTDTEVVLNTLIHFGDRGIEKLNGMFAFAFLDGENNEIILARDRYGVKPLYYYEDESHFIFSSEIKAILAHPKIRTGFNYDGLIEYFTFQNFFTDQTLFNKIKLLPAGSYLKYNYKKHTKKIVRYWDYSFIEQFDYAKENDYLERFHFLFEQAVSRQLVSDVSVNSYLSGGMDSSAITMLASKQVSNMKSFTVGFQSPLNIDAYDERKKAKYVSQLAGTEYHEVILRPYDMEHIIEKLVWHLEEPRVGQSYPNYFAAELAGKFGKVVLSGTGGDELFGGYPWRYYRAVVNESFEHYIDKYYSYWQRLLSHTEIKNLFSPINDRIKHINTRDIFKSVFNSDIEELKKPEDYVNHSLYFEAKNFLHGLLVVEDKLSMSQGLETRVPFLDNDLVDFSTKIPLRYKLGNLRKIIRLDENEPGEKTKKYYNKTKDGKLILRKAMERYLPESISNAKKQGFSGPDMHWFKGESANFISDTLFNRSAEIYNFMDYNIVRQLVLEHLESKKNKRLLIWSLLYMENFLKIFKKFLN